MLGGLKETTPVKQAAQCPAPGTKNPLMKVSFLDCQPGEECQCPWVCLHILGGHWATIPAHFMDDCSNNSFHLLSVYFVSFSSGKLLLNLLPEPSFPWGPKAKFLAVRRVGCPCFSWGNYLSAPSLVPSGESRKRRVEFSTKFLWGS